MTAVAAIYPKKISLGHFIIGAQKPLSFVRSNRSHYRPNERHLSLPVAVFIRRRTHSVNVPPRLAAKLLEPFDLIARFISQGSADSVHCTSFSDCFLIRRDASSICFHSSALTLDSQATENLGDCERNVGVNWEILPRAQRNWLIVDYQAFVSSDA